MNIVELAEAVATWAINRAGAGDVGTSALVTNFAALVEQIIKSKTS